MSVENPKEFWKNVSSLENWKDYILPKRSDESFDKEGFLESERMFYFFDDSDVVIDYGCGIGRVSKYVVDRAKQVIGLDINEDFIGKADKYVNKNNANFFVADSYDKKNCANFIYCLMVFQHNDSKNRNIIINHIKKLLKESGEAIIQFPKFESEYYKESDFVHKFTRDEVINYGIKFSNYKIVEGNLIEYATKINKKINHEYFLIIKK